MTKAQPSPFPDTPHTPAGHFALWLYRSIYRLLLQTKRISELNGETIEAVFNDFPFLAHYLDEMQRSIPEGLSWDEGDTWWITSLEAWQKTHPGHLPLRALQRDLELSRDQVMVLMLAGLVEEDSRFGTLFSVLQSPLTNRRPTLELLGQIVIDNPFAASHDSWALCRPLLEAGLLETPDQQVPRSEWLLRVPPLLWDAMRGDKKVSRELGLSFEATDEAAGPKDLVAPDAFKQQLLGLPALLTQKLPPLLVLRGMHGAPLRHVSRAVAQSLGLGTLRLDASLLEDSSTRLRQLVGPACTLLGALPIVQWELGPGETKPAPTFSGYAGPVLIELGLEGGMSSDQRRGSLTLELPFPTPLERSRLLKDALGSYAPPELDGIARNFQLPGELLERLAESAIVQATLQQRQRVAREDLQKASEWLGRQKMGDLAERIDTHGSWEELVASRQAREKLRELESRCRQREALFDHLGRGFGRGNRGIRALFSGPSGTGKTLAARVLANVLGLDLYRVDLAAVVNKYIGETEKNLHQVLSRAEALDIVLLIDEGDALLGRRTDVRSANDRYANLETNYLLQRLEHYQGIVVVTTNLGDNIDTAFQRRMDVVVNFLAPGLEERRDILELHLPQGHDVPEELLDLVAGQCRLTGGQLRNAALLSVLLALEEGAEKPLGERHLVAALRSEYRKMGALFPLDTRRPSGAAEAEMDALRVALDLG